MSDYNGWSNWETWNLFNWIANTEAPQPVAEGDLDQVAAMLREQYMEALDDMPQGFERDALTRTYEAVDWQELAEALTS